MNIQEVRARFIAAPSAGVANLKDTRLDMALVDNIANQTRAKAIANRVKMNSPLHNSWYMNYEPEYDKNFQNNGELCFVRFKMIPYIAISSKLDGINFIGGSGTNCQYRLVNDRGTFASNQNDKLLRAKQREGLVHVLMDGDVMEAYSKININSIMIRLIPQNPFDIPTWNPDVDQYPIDTGLLDDMLKIFMQTDLLVLTKSFYDRVTNGRDESVAPIPQSAT